MFSNNHQNNELVASAHDGCEGASSSSICCCGLSPSSACSPSSSCSRELPTR